MDIKPIAYYYSKLPAKFGVPRQSGLVTELVGRVVFEPEFRDHNALRGIEGFDYLWLLWGFSLNKERGSEWSPLVRPPLLGGNEYVGVFAMRSPYRPNAIGLSSVRLAGVEDGDDGPVLLVAGADLVSGTPIYDIKPYIAYSDSHPDARSGFVDNNSWHKLDLKIPAHLRSRFSDEDYMALCKLLELDPRPQYHQDPLRVYGMPFGGYDIRFRVSEEGVLEVLDAVSM